MRILRLSTFHLICLTVSLTLLSTITQGQDVSPVKKSRLETVTGSHLVRFADGYLTVKVQDVFLYELLDEIARQSGLSVLRYVALDQRVTLEFNELSLEQAFRHLLRHRSFVLEYAAARPTTLWILPQGEEKYGVQRSVVVSTNAGAFGKDVAKRIASLQVALNSEDAEEREEATAELGDTGHTKAVAPLTLALADGNRVVREAAIMSLAEIGGAEAVGALAIALRDEDPRVREEAVGALGEIGGETAITLLQQALADDVKFVRQAAAEVLDELRGVAQ